jgi:hypothetical protein
MLMGNFYFTSRNVIAFGFKLITALLLLIQRLAWARTSISPKRLPNLACFAKQQLSY